MQNNLKYESLYWSKIKATVIPYHHDIKLIHSSILTLLNIIIIWIHFVITFYMRSSYSEMYYSPEYRLLPAACVIQAPPCGVQRMML